MKEVTVIRTIEVTDIIKLEDDECEVYCTFINETNDGYASLVKDAIDCDKVIVKNHKLFIKEV